MGRSLNNNNTIQSCLNNPDTCVIDLSKINKYNGNGGGNGGDDMEERIIKLEAGIDFIKDKLSSHDDEFKKIDNKFDKIDARFDKIDTKFDEFNKQLFIMNGTLGEIKNQLTYTLTYKNLIKYTSSILALLIAFISIISAIAKYLLHLI